MRHYGVEAQGHWVETLTSAAKRAAAFWLARWTRLFRALPWKYCNCYCNYYLGLAEVVQFRVQGSYHKALVASWM